MGIRGVFQGNQGVPVEFREFQEFSRGLKDDPGVYLDNS